MGPGHLGVESVLQNQGAGWTGARPDWEAMVGRGNAGSDGRWAKGSSGNGGQCPVARADADATFESVPSRLEGRSEDDCATGHPTLCMRPVLTGLVSGPRTTRTNPQFRQSARGQNAWTESCREAQMTRVLCICKSAWEQRWPGLMGHCSVQLPRRPRDSVGATGDQMSASQRPSRQPRCAEERRER